MTECPSLFISVLSREKMLSFLVITIIVINTVKEISGEVSENMWLELHLR